MVKVERTFPAPASLAKEAEKKSGSYSEKDVMEQLRHDFNDKCYICEIKGLQDPQVEHLLPHKNGKYHDRKFDWNNLFWSCGHCNNVKNQEKYDAGIIDCCREDPERYLNFRLIDGEVSVTAKDGKNVVAERTAILVREVFSLKNTGMRVYKSDKRFKELSKEMLCQGTSAGVSTTIRIHRRTAHFIISGRFFRGFMFIFCNTLQASLLHESHPAHHDPSKCNTEECSSLLHNIFLHWGRCPFCILTFRSRGGNKPAGNVPGGGCSRHTWHRRTVFWCR